MTVSPPGSATTIAPWVARSPPAETKPSPSISASASSTACPLTTPLRSSLSPAGRRTRDPVSRISRQRPAGTAGRDGGASTSPNERSYPAETRASAMVGSTRPSVASAAARAFSSARARSGEVMTVSARRCVQALKLRVWTEPTERHFEGDEEALDRRDLLVGRTTHDDLGSHRVKGGRAHDVRVVACGWLDGCDGSTEPERKNEPVLSASRAMRSEMLRAPLVGTVACVPAVPGWALRTTTERAPNPATATPAAATLRKRARRRAGAMREEDEEDTPPWKRSGLRASCERRCVRVKGRFAPCRPHGRACASGRGSCSGSPSTVGRLSDAHRTRRRSGLRAVPR